MLLIYTKKVTPRVTHSFKHICTNILGLDIKFTQDVNEFVAYEGAKISYGKEKLGNEIFIQNVDLLFEQGINDIEIKTFDWEGTCCFFSVSENSSLPFDIFAASFFLLSRYEEYLPHVKNLEGRFPSLESLAYSRKFLRKPVVDIWAYKFKEILQSRFPNLEFRERSYKTNNIITVSQIFKYRKKGFIRIATGILKDLSNLKFSLVKERISILFKLKEDPYNVFDEFIEFHKEHKIDFHFMFQLSDFSTHDRNINHRRRYYKTLIKHIGDYCKVGLKLGFFASDNLKTLKREKLRLEAIINRPVLCVINNQFNLLLPDGYNNMAELEIKEDFSMGYPERMGFRAGTCTPFMFYDLNFEITTPLLIQPYMFSTRIPEREDFSKLKNELKELVDEVKKVNGSFGAVFSNEDFATEENKTQFFSIIKMINEST